ncbi:hypothetical protein F2Q70_00040518 [Brassica cretica]|uniref:Uncharacterized protein n=1 Tax=Brassica cretica TaxID=69181 RepID=A0A8S9K2X9_BRACR|nr:hypothetical protein F2Q70_00040518 [Brassica cretica]
MVATEEVTALPIGDNVLDQGKMVEEADSKWVKVADRGNNGSFSNHRSYKGDGNGSRHRSSRREEHRAEGQGFSRRTGQDSSCRSEVISDPMDAEEGLQMIKSLIVEPSILEDDKVLDMDECRAIFLEHGIDMDAADDLPDCSDEEFEEMLKEQDDEEAIPADLENGNMEVEKEPVEGDVVKKQGTRKTLFKPRTPGVRR